MSEQDDAKPSTKQRRSRKTGRANQQNGNQAHTPQRPENDDIKAWEAFWKTQGQTWRTEPEIDVERQQYLAERQNIEPNIEQGIYPFKDIKLSRADIEWLLAKHENGRGPIDWSDKSQRERIGLDLCGADLRQVNLRLLPLACTLFGLNWEEWIHANSEQRSMARALLEGVFLEKAHLEGAFLMAVHLESVSMWGANLQEINLHEAHLERANISSAHMEGARLIKAHLEEANFVRSHLEGTLFQRAHLEGANFRDAFFNTATRLDDVALSNEMFGSVSVVDIHWGGVNLSVTDWLQVKVLGDERTARQYQKGKQWSIDRDGKRKDRWFINYQWAVSANRQLAVVLRDQGLNEDAVRFAYRAQLLQCKVLWYQRKFGQYLFSLFLNLFAGYGYKPGRSFIAYAVVISIFATIYHLLGTHLAWNEAFVISMTAFHGRGFFPDQFHPGDPQALVAAIEAFVGLIIEVTLIATLTQRLFGK